MAVEKGALTKVREQLVLPSTSENREKESSRMRDCP